MNLVVRPAAEADIERQLRWLAHRSPAAASKLGDELQRALDLLCEFPNMGSARGRHRVWPVEFGEAGFVLYYRLDADTLYLERVRHGREDR